MKKLVMRCGCWWLPGACRTAGNIRARRRPVSESLGLLPPPEPPPGLGSGCRCASAAVSLDLESFSSMLYRKSQTASSPAHLQSDLRPIGGTQRAPRAPTQPSPPSARAATVARAGVLQVAGRARSQATFGSTECVSKSPVSGWAGTRGDSTEAGPGLGDAPGSRWSPHSAGDPGRPCGSALLLVASSLGLLRGRLGHRRAHAGSAPSALTAARTRLGSHRSAVATRRSRPTLEAEGRGLSARTQAPARTWKPVGPRCALPAPGLPAPGRRPDAGRGAPRASACAPAEPRVASRPETHGWGAGGRAGQGLPRSLPPGPRALAAFAFARARENFRPLSAT